MRKSGGPRVLIACAVMFLASVAPAAPAHAAFVGECAVVATTSYTGVAPGVFATMRIEIRNAPGTSCLHVGTSGALLVKSDVTAPVVGPCFTGDYPNGGAIISVGTQTSSATATASQGTVSLAFAATGTTGIKVGTLGALYATNLVNSGCPTTWAGVVLVEEASL